MLGSELPNHVTKAFASSHTSYFDSSFIFLRYRYTPLFAQIYWNILHVTVYHMRLDSYVLRRSLLCVILIHMIQLSILNVLILLLLLQTILWVCFYLDPSKHQCLREKKNILNRWGNYSLILHKFLLKIYVYKGCPFTTSSYVLLRWEDNWANVKWNTHLLQYNFQNTSSIFRFSADILSALLLQVQQKQLTWLLTCTYFFLLMKR